MHIVQGDFVPSELGPLTFKDKELANFGKVWERIHPKDISLSSWVPEFLITGAHILVDRGLF